MSRGLTDAPLPPEEEDDDQAQLDGIINELIVGQNKLHDRLVDLERQVDHLVAQNKEQTANITQVSRRWKKGL